MRNIKIHYLFILLFANVTLLTEARATRLSEMTALANRNERVQETLSYLHRHVLATSQGICATHVRKAYMASGLIHSHPGIEYAKNYHPYFLANGWKNVLAEEQALKVDLFQSPPGCAVVYDAIDSKNDRNGHIGHIEVKTNHLNRNGFISDYFSKVPRSGLVCISQGKKVKRLRTFTARKGSPHYSGNQVVKVYIEVTLCNEYSDRGSFVSDEFTNRKASGVFCKLEN